MSRYDLIGQLPHHQYCFVDTSFTHRMSETPSIPAIWFGLVSYPSRTLGCTVLLESGAVYRNLPLHALAHTPEGLHIPWRPQDAQHWDCYSSGFTTLCYDTLRGLECLAKTADAQRRGEYLCTIAPIGDAYSAVPAQSKELVLVALTNGRYTLQPTDRVVFSDLSFTTGGLAFPRGLKRQDETYSAEGEQPALTQGVSRADSRRALKDAIQGDALKSVSDGGDQ
jgi:hypothetical protein